MTAKTRAIPSLHRDSFLAKVPGLCPVLRRVTQPPHIAGPLGVICATRLYLYPTNKSITYEKKYLVIFLLSSQTSILYPYVVGIFLMFLTIFTGALNPQIGILTLLTIFILSIIYQIIRQKFKFYSFGEILLQNTDKSNILIQNKTITITRIPLFLVIIITLLFSGNILDGISNGQVYTIGMIVIFCFLTYCTYYGMTGFVKTLKISSILLLISGMLLTGLPFLISAKLGKTGDMMFYIYLILSLIWLTLGFIYNSK